MSDIEISRVIDATPEELYDIVSDLPNMGRLSPENTGGIWIKGATGPKVGARFRGTNRSKKAKWATTATVVEADRGKAFAIAVTVGPMKISQWGYRFEPVDGGTKVTETWDDRRSNLTRKLSVRASGVKDREAYNKANIYETLAALADLVAESKQETSDDADRIDDVPDTDPS